MPEEKWRQVISKIIQVKDQCNITKINFVGGEPTLTSYLPDLIEICNAHGLECAFTTNGTGINLSLIHKVAGKVSYIGLSIDSISPRTNRRLGRCCNDKSLSLVDIVNISDLLKEYRIPLKINRVLSYFNKDEDPACLLDSITFERLKLLELYVNKNINDSSNTFKLSRSEFDEACRLYSKYGPEIENNNAMTDGYSAPWEPAVRSPGNRLSGH